MALSTLAPARGFHYVLSSHKLLLGQIASYQRSQWIRNRRGMAAQASATGSEERPSASPSPPSNSSPSSSAASTPSSRSISSAAQPASTTDESNTSLLHAWEDGDLSSVEDFSQLPHKDFGKNQLMETNEEFKRALKRILKHFPHISHAFAYGSGVFPQSDVSASKVTLSPHPNPPEAILKWQKGGGKMIDFIFATKFSQHFHSLNLRQNRDHYSFLGSLGSGAIAHVQDRYGAGVYFNPYITVEGTLIKYGVVNLSTLHRDLSEWDTLYLAGRLHKPVKILYEDPSIRVANQRNLMAAVRCSLLLLGSKFTEKELYTTIASLSYRGDPRMSMGSENPKKVDNIVTHQMRNFRQLYSDLIQPLPNLNFNDPHAMKNADWQEDISLNIRMEQNMDPAFRGNMVRRLPRAFREKLYFLYQRKFGIPGGEFKKMLEESSDEDKSGSVRKPVGGPFDRRIASQPDLVEMVGRAVKQTVEWPSTTQSVKSFFTAGFGRSWRYIKEKREKSREGSSSKKE